MSNYEDGQGCAVALAFCLFVLGSITLFSGAIPVSLGLYVLAGVLFFAIDE